MPSTLTCPLARNCIPMRLAAESVKQNSSPQVILEYWPSLRSKIRAPWLSILTMFLALSAALLLGTTA